MMWNNSTVVTPADDPVGYQLDWRRQLAVSSIMDRLPPTHASDTDLRAYWPHLRHRAKHPQRNGEQGTQYDQIDAWRLTHTGRLLEAYLVTTASYGTIAADLGLEQESVRLYGAIHWDIRAGTEVARTGAVACLRAVHDMKDRFMRVALAGGLMGLRSTVGMGTDKEGVAEMVETELKLRLQGGQMATRDLTRLQANAIMCRRIELESQTEASPLVETAKTIQLLLSTLAPVMKVVRKTGEESQTEEAELRARIESQKQVSGIGMQRAGEGRFDSLLKRV